MFSFFVGGMEFYAFRHVNVDLYFTTQDIWSCYCSCETLFAWIFYTQKYTAREKLSQALTLQHAAQANRNNTARAPRAGCLFAVSHELEEEDLVYIYFFVNWGEALFFKFVIKRLQPFSTDGAGTCPYTFWLNGTPFQSARSQRVCLHVVVKMAVFSDSLGQLKQNHTFVVQLLYCTNTPTKLWPATAHISACILFKTIGELCTEQVFWGGARRIITQFLSCNYSTLAKKQFWTSDEV